MYTNPKVDEKVVIFSVIVIPTAIVVSIFS